jgi:PAS domain S-box-containing protein
MSQPARLLVLGGAPGALDEARERLAAAGFEVTTDARAVADLPDDPTRVFDAILVFSDDPDHCRALRSRPQLAGLPLVAAVAPGKTGRASELIAAGADDVVCLPLASSGADARLRGLLAAAAVRADLDASEATHEAWAEICRLVGRGEHINETLRDVLLAAAPVLGFERASLVVISEIGDQAFVIAATDDPTLSKFVVSLDVYAELRQAITTREPVLIEDAPRSPLLASQAEFLRKNDVNAIAVVPIEWRGRVTGFLFLRSSRHDAARLSPTRLRFAKALAALVAREVGGGEALAAIREQTHRVSLLRYESERRLRAIEQLREYFEAASDGVAVMDGEGKVLYVNRAAEAITGFAREGLIGQPLVDLVPEAQRDGVQEVIYRVQGGTNLEAFDLDLTTTSGDPICVSVATSTVLSEHGAAILSFRDVTAERALETELRKTKEFLEKLIDSAVDAVISADMTGNIILFNPGAERIYGYRADEVVGKMSVEKLYPEGVGRQIMRMLRSPSYGGVGRLELTRREILTKDGEVIPVNMTASIIYEDGREVATVGLISDLRDRIKIEQRLLQAQEKLLISEKQALVAELAGAAAHELNQPLTSIMGYAELMKRRMKPDDPNFRAVDTVLREAQRMAEIVKKIGRITKYETKAYVGSAQILDLEKSSEARVPEFEQSQEKTKEHRGITDKKDPGAGGSA